MVYLKFLKRRKQTNKKNKKKKKCLAYLEVALLQVDLGAELLREKLELFVEHGWRVEQVDDGVEAVRHSDDVRAERRARLVLDVELL